MKILQILPELNSGGVERGTLEIGQFLVEQGHESLVISHGGLLVPQLESEGSRHITLPVHKKSLSSLAQVRPFRALLEKEKPDILHLRSRVPAWIAYLAWKKMDPATRPRLITTIHGFYSVNYYSQVMTLGEAVICVSESVREYALKSYKAVDPNKLTVIHRGVDPEAYPVNWKPDNAWSEKWNNDYPQLNNSKYIICLPGRVTRWKGHEDFLKIISELRTELPNVHGIIAGAPHPRKISFLEELKEQVKELDLTDHITFLGHRKDLKEVMSASNIVLTLSTDPEAFGRVSLEALTLGKPVAGYSHGGVGEQLTALLPEGQITPGDWASLITLIKKWATTPPQPASNIDFTLQAMKAKTLTVYENLFKSPRPQLKAKPIASPSS